MRFLLLAVAALYLAESCAWLLGWRAARRERNQKIEYAAGRCAVFDLRTQGEVIRALRAKGTPAYPVAHRGQAMALQPLGGISNVTTVYGNESGEFLVYSSDEHGFHNPPGMWSAPRLDVALVGDSLAHGASVPSASNLAAMVRLRYPATLNLGYDGNGPLSELGTILEYLPQRRPRAVLWACCAESSPLEGGELQGYLARPPRLQQLERRQAEIDRELRRCVDAGAGRRDPSPLGGWLKLTDLRSRASRYRRPSRPDFDTFARALQAARDAAAGWGGRLVFVYLPNAGWRAESLDVCRRLGIPVLDIDRRFAGERDRFEDYFYTFPAHFTESGYRRAGQMILEELEKVR